MILETQPSQTMSIFGGILYEIFVCMNNLRDYFENGIMVVKGPKCKHWCHSRCVVIVFSAAQLRLGKRQETILLFKQLLELEQWPSGHGQFLRTHVKVLFPTCGSMHFSET